MNLGSAGKKLIKSYEGCRLTAYKAVSTELHWTIGWGHYGPDVKKGQTITQAQADALFDKDVQRYVDAVNKLGINFNQNQFDALVSFCYNCGPGNLLKLCLGKTITKISNDILLYNKSGGKVLAGLVKRRTAEKDLFCTPVVSKASEPVDTTPYRLATGNFGSKESLERAKKKLFEKYSWLVYEKITGSEFRLVTGTFKGKDIAERHAAALRKDLGWTVYVQEV
ncbi:glycoside hydrolase family protein [Bacillus sp. CGMCC 1.16607]|uniref:glycoside hydrolase family protein n=1 Tax=Bacillus sp. CGMCC 1.16607 TaxID=3351842 RepID=UPI00363B18F3